MILVLSNRKAFLKYPLVDGLQVVCSQDWHVRAIRCLHRVSPGLKAMGGWTRKLVLLPLHAIQACGSLHLLRHNTGQVWESKFNLVHSLTSNESVVLPCLEG